MAVLFCRDQAWLGDLLMIDRVATVVATCLRNDDNAEEIARAVIEAMRKPSDGMIAAGELFYEVTRTQARIVWEQMIDAALAEKA
jgi:hypothetical protein